MEAISGVFGLIVLIVSVVFAIAAIFVPINIWMINSKLKKLLDAQKNTKNNDFYNKKILETLQEIQSNTCNYEDK